MDSLTVRAICLQESGEWNEDTARFVDRMGLDGFAEWLAGLERSDAECVKFPRAKRSDDKTAVLLIFPDAKP